MAILIASSRFHFAQPGWLFAAALALPLAWMAWRNLAALGSFRRVLVIALRVIGVALLAAILAHPMLSRTHERVTLVAISDRSQSIPQGLLDASEDYLNKALARADVQNRLGVVHVAEAAAIAQMPSGVPAGEKKLGPRSLGLSREQTNLAAAVQLAQAIAPPDTALRLLLITDGNETAGDLLEAALTAKANGIPIDVLPLQYHHDREVVFTRLVAPPRARNNETISLRLVLSSTVESRGRLILSINGEPVPLDETSSRLTLHPGANVKTVSLPLGSRGVHSFEARFLPASSQDDTLAENNVASAVTYVAGPGHVLVIAMDAARAEPVRAAVASAGIDTKYCSPGELPTDLPSLIDADGVVIVDVPNGELSLTQQEMLVRYVKDLGGGLVVLGGPDSFGAGGWIGSPVAEVLPLDLDPPQKKEMPKGALALVMHACEMPQGNRWGKETAIAAVKALSRLDLVGVLDYTWNTSDNSHWVFPLGLVGDKTAPISAIKRMEMGDMPDFNAPLQAAYTALQNAKGVGQKHIIIISDGDPSPATPALLAQMKSARITVTCVSVFPHGGMPLQGFQNMAAATGGRYYNENNPNNLPQIFVKEAQVVRKTLIVEESFTPKLADPLSEITRGLGGLPPLEGYVLTGPKGGAARVILTSHQADPILAAGQSGLGRCVAFTAAADGRWGPAWLAWGGFPRFCQQMVRWAAKPGQSTDCEIYTDVEGRRVTVTVEAQERDGKQVELANPVAQTIAPDMSSQPLVLEQVGPGRFRGSLEVGQSGSYLVNVRYQKGTGQATTRGAPAESAPAGAVGLAQSVVTVPFAPEYRDSNDNLPLLDRVAKVTGGRILPSSPDKVDLFSHAGLAFPKTSLPLNLPLMIAWLAVFWLDVATRRVALDARAIARRIAQAFRPSLKSAESQQVLQQLRQRRKVVREELDERAEKEARRTAAHHYEGGEGAPDVELRMADTAARKAAPPAGIAPAKTGEADPNSHLNRLLKAKRSARSRMDEAKREDSDEDKSGS